MMTVLPADPIGLSIGNDEIWQTDNFFEETEWLVANVEKLEAILSLIIDEFYAKIVLH